MTQERLIEEFERLNNEVFSGFGDRPLLPDLVAMNQLARWKDGTHIIQAAEHDQVWFGVNLDQMADSFEDESSLVSKVKELSALGVSYDPQADALCMYV